MGLFRPEFKEQGSLQNEGHFVLRLADPEEQAFQGIFRQQQTEFLFAITRQVEEALPNGSCDVGDRFTHDSDSM